MVSVVVLFATVVAFLYSSYESNRNIDIAGIVNLAGRQRMLSQRIGRLAEIERNQTKSAETSTHDELESVKLRFERESVLLTEKVSQAEFLSSPKLRDGLSSLGLVRADILSRLDEISANGAGGSSSKSEAYQNLHAKIDQFLPGMESVVSLIGSTNDDFVASSRVRQNLGFAMVLLVTIASLLVFIIPTFRALNVSATEQFRLSHEQERLAMVVARTSNSVIVTDCDGRIQWTNPGFTRFTEFSMDEVIGKKPGKFLQYEKSDPVVIGQIRLALKECSPIRCQLQNRSKSGREYWLDIDIQPMFDSAGQHVGFMSVELDITDLKVAQSKAESASRAKSEFLANMSHEIRTPMTAILGYADILADEVGRPDSTIFKLKCVETIKRNGEHLLAIINDILDISKIEAEKMEVESIDTDPQQILEHVLSLMRVKAMDKGLAFMTDFTRPIPKTIQSDPTRLRQILVNLIGNAIKFTEHGFVSLSTSFEPGPDPVIRFVVRDSGIGMSKEQTSRLFRAFEQADSSTTRRFGGTGLGMLISKQLAQLLDGDLEVASEYGGGSEFTLTLKAKGAGPLHQVGIEEPITKKAPVESIADPEASLLLANMRILFAEDGPDNQRLISFHLRKAGAIVTIVENGKEAVQMLTTDGSVDGPILSPVPFDLILLDMQMPEMDGYFATRFLRSKSFSLPILALTAHAMAGDAKQCVDAGCDEHLTKPINRSLLVEACEKWGRGAQHVWNETALSAIVSVESFATLTSENTASIGPVRANPEVDDELLELMRDYRAGLPSLTFRIERMWSSRSLDELKTIAHQVKGSAGGYGMPSLSNVAGQFETALRQESSMESIQASFQELIDELQRSSTTGLKSASVLSNRND